MISRTSVVLDSERWGGCIREVNQLGKSDAAFRDPHFEFGLLHNHASVL